LTVPSASALPVGLMASTSKAALAIVAGQELAGMVSATVAELVRSMTAATIASKAKLAVVVLLAMSLLTVATSGALVSWHGRASEPPTAKDDEKPKAVSPRRDAAKTTEIQGRVVDPDDKPVKDAHLYWPCLRKDRPKAEYRLETGERGHTDDEGHFRIPLSVSDDLDVSLRTLIVTAAGYGLNWVDVPKTKSSENITVRLRKDVTIRGRILSMEGKPLAGVQVLVDHLEEMPNGRLDDYLAFWDQDWNKALWVKTRRLEMPLPFKLSMLPAAVTDRNGHFQLSGVGSERLVYLAIRGESIVHTVLPIVARPGFDPSALNKSARNSKSMMGVGIPGPPPVMYGPTFDYVAPPARIVEGVVREAGSCKPIPSVHVLGNAGYRTNSEAITDKEGRYRLEGLPKVKHYAYFHAMPPGEGPWLPTIQNNVEAAMGLQPVRVDFTLGRGVTITGRVIDRATGKGVRSSVRYAYLPDNKFAGTPGYDPHVGGYGSDDDGRFRFKVAPGTGVLEATPMGVSNPYKPAQFDAADRKHITFTKDGDFVAFGGGGGFLSLQNAVKRLDLAADALVVEQNLYVEPGAIAKVRIQDPPGKPLAGVIVSGIDAIPGQHSHKAYVAPEAECTIVALDPQQPRQVIFYHAQRRLAGALTVRGDEKEPLTVRLAPTGTVIGRIRGADGQPIRGVDVEIWAKGPPASTALIYLYIALNQNRLPVRTDKEGRFRLEGVVPDGAFEIDVRHRGAYLDLGSRTKQLQVKAGEALDLGDIVVKSAQ
jgi:hypothetical protein